MEKRIRLDETALRNAVLGGCILGGGGGGSRQRGAELGQIAIGHTELYLTDIDELEEDSLLLTAALVGAPSAEDQFITPEHMVRTVELVKHNMDLTIGGIITNENGGEATVNGWIQAAMTGLPLVDSPCNGRAHPTGVMGSMNLHKDPTYVTTQAAVGGNPEINKYMECLYKGTIDTTARLVRATSVEAGGVVGVARNPVPVSYAKKNGAAGGISHAIALGDAFYKGLDRSPENAVNAVVDHLGGKILGRGVVEEFSIAGEGGFDIGTVKVAGMELTFWNEYMTADLGDKRMGTFPELIMTLDALTGEPVTTAEMAVGKDVYVIFAPMTSLKLSVTMYEKELIRQVEEIIGKEMISYLPLD